MEPQALLDLAEILEYPAEERIAGQRAALARLRPRAAEGSLERLAALLEARDPGPAQELYSRTFDSRQETALEAGWHLYGENYHRGRLLVVLREDLRRAGVDEQGQLPDWIPTLLRLAAVSEDGRRRDLLAGIVAPAARRIAVPLEVEDSPWAGVLALLIEACPSTEAAGTEALGHA